MKKLLAFGLCVVLLLGIAVPAFAADTAAVDYCGVNIVVDGARLCPKDADGKPVEPFILNGTTYLPVRAVANALGLEVGWEPGTVKLTSGAERTAAIGQPIESTRTRTITIGGQDTKVTLDGKELDLKDAAGNPVTPIISDGTTYLPVRAVADALNVPVLWDGETATVYLGKAIEWKVAKRIYAPGDDSGFTSECTYDKMGRTTSVITQRDNMPEGERNIVRYAYDDAGNVIWKETDFPPEHFEQRWSYDKDGREISSTFTPADYAPGEFTTTYTYDEQGELIAVHGKQGNGDEWESTYVNEYNADGQLIQTTQHGDEEFTATTTYSYDSYGNLSEQRYSDSRGIEESESWTYDAAGNLLSTERHVASFSQQRVYTYDAVGNVLSETRTETSAYSGESLVIQTEYVYDDWGNVLERKWTNGNNFRHEKYVYDQFNNCIEEVTEYNGTVSKTVYVYSEGNLLMSMESDGDTTVYTYDQYGNLLTVRNNGRNTDTYEYTAIYH